MKKLFNYALMAAALLVGVNVNAEDVVTVTMNGGSQNYETVGAAFEAVYNAAQFNTPEQKTEATIKLLADVNLAWEEWMPGTSPKIELNEGEYITIDLNGKNFQNAVRFNLHRAGIELAGAGNFTSTAGQTFTAYGDDVNVAAEYGYSKIIIGKDVNFTMATHYAIAVANNGGKKYDKCFAAGVQVDIYGTVLSRYGMSVSGNLQLTPSIEPTYTCPVINIHKDARFIGGIYAAGYAIWNLEGYVEGATAVYAKSGVINVIGGTLVGTGEYAEPKPNGNGADETGAAISLDTHGSYAGEIELHISGDATIKSENGNGIEEFVTKGTDNQGQPIDDHCDSITITGGTIIAAEGMSSITTTEEVKENGVSVGGGTFNTDITEYLGPDNIITPVDKDGKIEYVISTKDPDKDWKNDITTAEDSDYVKVPTGENQELTDDVEAKYLVQEGNSTITVSEDVTLTVGEIVMSKDAQIIVKPGATLIVKDDKGIVANQAQNIILQSEENKPAYLLLDPQVTSNKTPKATIKFYSDAFSGVNGDQQQLFGNPMAAVTSVKAFQAKDDAPAEDRIFFDLWKKNAWNYLGGINVDDPIDYSKFNEQFGLYCITSKNTKENKLYYVLEGNAVGNSQPESFKLNYGWTSAANSWTGDMDGEKLIEKLDELSNDAENLHVNVYLATVQGTVITWNGYGMAAVADGNFKVQPLQPMMFDNEEPKVITSDIMSYENLVWNPATKGGNQAPRHNSSDIQKVNIRLTSEEGLTDRVVVASTKDYSDPRYSARKYMNDDICIYVNMDKKYDSYMAEDVNNALIGFNCAKAGQYTLSFEGVTGDFALIDLTNNARINMVEGATYEFLAEEGENANRFMVVEGAKAPTNNEKVNGAVKAMKVISGGEFRIVKENRAFNAMGAEL